MLKDTRFAPHSQYIGDFSRHYGIFAVCGTTMPFDATAADAAAGACC
jgi:arsenite methyltransferase